VSLPALVSTRLAGITHPIGACVIGIFGGGAAAAFALLHGAGNGILTIARGTLPLAIFGPENYAYRLGLSARRPGSLRRWLLSRTDCCWSLWGAASSRFRRASAFRR